MNLILPLTFMLLFIIIIAYWNYDQYGDQRKRFKEHRNIAPELFELKKT